ncbi:efflux RND transporter periplasmic adaptor subunit [Shewanella eurypsychrophilus]|uniref:Efflux RND transporter periplasmic adaptor subunit n=1 Tax=Shewanella eurypsychrophilus TaxID=2593656 RepID=A0ABX6V217_9GAMM|nr:MULTISPECIES: efflux RND transporter periplasmic adaptor subunit [Shewanella]QFU21374.1 multidrug transporter [Shewanella sp. YLB-09]QPG56664.1 efflux RND transporter periplasmic adaptor subunit [Shewanella eurypsychrophilus]
MKEIMLPYIFIVWLLFKFKVIKPRPRNYFISVFIGCLIAITLFIAHRFYSPADLTNSTIVRAPHSVLSPALGQQIDKIYVDHNQYVNEGELLYTLRDDSVISAIDEVLAKKQEIQRTVEAKQVEFGQANRDYIRNQRIQDHVSERDLENSGDRVEIIQAELRVLEAQLDVQKAKLRNQQYELSRLNVTAPFDGMVTHVYIAGGSRVGAMHFWQTNNKFVEMRIPDQSFAYIKKGQFAEFYIDAYPGQIFRARVHSKVEATGEAQGDILPREQSVGRHISLGAMPIGRTVILEVDEDTMAMLPIGATGSAWISADKPHSILGFLDIIGAATVRLVATKSYLKAI